MAVNFAVKKWFFTTKLVQALVDGRTSRGLIATGRYIVNAAKWSMLRRADPNEHSPPGVPPYAHKNGALRRHIYYAYSPADKNVVAGPVPLGAVGDTPRIHEHGFTGARLIRNKRRRVRKLGKPGEIRLTTKTTTRFADSPHGRGEIQVQDTSTVAVYARLRTPAQVARANRLNEELYGAMYAIKSVTYPPRAYMAPALASAKKIIPTFWQASVAAPAVA